MRKSFVYLGLVPADGDAFFVKVGKTNHPEKREKGYATHIPGGLQSMHAVEVKSASAAFAAESRMIARIRRLPYASWPGGEWTRVSGDSLAQVFEWLSECGEPFRVDCAVDRRQRHVFGR